MESRKKPNKSTGATSTIVREKREIVSSVPPLPNSETASRKNVNPDQLQTPAPSNPEHLDKQSRVLFKPASKSDNESKQVQPQVQIEESKSVDSDQKQDKVKAESEVEKKRFRDSVYQSFLGKEIDESEIDISSKKDSTKKSIKVPKTLSPHDSDAEFKEAVMKTFVGEAPSVEIHRSNNSKKSGINVIESHSSSEELSPVDKSKKTPPRGKVKHKTKIPQAKIK